jgi:two-component system OmpR family sensor kinase/two-component system sensor histidine kinase QseC
VRERIAAAAALRSLTPLVIFAPIVALAIWWLVGLALKPVLRVASELRSRDAQRLDPVSDDELPAEIEPMIRQLNGLLDRLRSAFAAQRAFVADAAHELRTPIAALKLQTGLLGRAGDEAGRADALRELNAGVDRSAHLVDQLLALARNEPGARPAAGRDAASADTDLAATARDAIAGLRTLAQARGSTVALTAPQSLPIHADPDAMQALVRNLVDNALRHSPPGSRVEVEVAQQGDEARLIVDDSGSGIPEADRDRVFDRFHRRNTGNEPGSGLGLAIVKAIVDRHDGRIELVDSPLGGLRAAVRLPSRIAS